MSTTLPYNILTPSIQQGFNPNVSKVIRVDLTIAQVTNLFTSPQPILPALTGYMYSPVSALFIRTGSPYLTAGGGVISIQTDSASFVQWHNAVATFLTAAGSKFASHTNGGFSLAADDAAGSLGSKGLRIMNTVGNPTVNGANPGSNLIILLTYNIYPTYAENVGSY